MAHDDHSSIEQLEAVMVNLDHFFLLINGLIIFFMQAGFAFLEAGSVRAKNTTNILIKNLLDVFLGAIAYWAVGYAFAFGVPGNGFIGHSYFFFAGFDEGLLSHFFFQFVFAATAATIVSGSMAERTEFKAYMIYSVVITGFVYPVVSHWAWSGDASSTGWLYNGVNNGSVTYQDFAGSSVVHMVGGIAALVGATILGPRIGRFDQENIDKGSHQGHTVPLVALGGFILFFGFFAFNGGSQAAISSAGDGLVVANAIVNTVISGATAALVALGMGKFIYGTKKWSLLTTINGGLAGMVAICAGCNSMYAWGAFVTGGFAGAVFIGVSALMFKLRIDDPLDAVAVHLGGGFWGIFTAPFFARDTGILFAWDGPAFAGWGWNVLGALVISVWTTALSILLFGGLHLLGILRVNPETEYMGLDEKEHGEPAYPILSYVGNDNKYTSNGGTSGLPPQAVHQEASPRGHTNEALDTAEMATEKEAAEAV